MAKTLKEVATMVLTEIGRLPDGQVAPASQIKKVTDKYSGLYEELLNDSFVNWAEGDDIPEFGVNAIVILLSSRVAFSFGVPNVWVQFEEVMRKKLSSQVASPYVPQPTQFENI